MGDRALKTYRCISASPLPPKVKFGIVKAMRNLAYAVRRDKTRHACLIMSNEGYGHEYWLKEYSGYRGDVFAQIEHGVYFGRNVSPHVNVIPNEWEISAFLTYGPYRKKLICEAYPNALVQAVGPYIQYVKTDENYREELRGSLQPGQRTLVLFPAHSVSNGYIQFSHEALIQKCIGYARNRGINNLIVCLSPMDINGSLANAYRENGFVVATCGNVANDFLPRQRAIFELADITISNAMGTHIGYSIYMGVPHRIIEPVSLDAKVAGRCIAPGVDLRAYSMERDLFLEAFYIDDEGRQTTPLQQNLYEEYWGGNICLEPDEMFEVLEACFTHRGSSKMITRK